ncbi:MAG: hypothetical protein JWN73_2738 [Betaproteobacteria bacterium]|nr:hypothetical protein [Betaproteobacteria bacterium]
MSPGAGIRALLLLCGLVGASAAQAQGAAQWWIGFVDTRNHAFLELPATREACAAREAALKRAPQAAGTLLAGALKPEAFVPPGARLLFGVSDLRGRYVERVLPRVAAIARADEREQGACWYLAEAGTEPTGYIAEEDTLAIATLPPRRLALRLASGDWRSYGSAAQVDGRFAAMEGAPAAWRARVEKLLPAYTQVYGQGFSAVLEKGAAPQNLGLIGAIDDGKGEAYNTLNLILRADGEKAGEAPLYQSGPSGGVAANRAGSFVAQAVAAVDLDGDGVDEIILRARYFSGGNLKVLKLVNGALMEIRQSAYEGE